MFHLKYFMYVNLKYFLSENFLEPYSPWSSWCIYCTYYPWVSVSDNIIITLYYNMILTRSSWSGLTDPFFKNTLGWGVFTKRTFTKGEFLLEYKGELVSEKEACVREATYPADVGSFLFFFQHGSRSLW